MKNTGKLLQDKRESAGLTLSEVALATKINPKVLTAIESGDEGHLPARTILKGFVRSYALFLKMDVEGVLKVFHEETGAPAPSAMVPPNTNEPPSSVTAPNIRRRMNDENSSSMRTAAVVVIVLLIGLIIGVRELIEKYQREKVTVASEPATNTNAPVAAEPAANNNVTPAPATATTPPPVAVTPPPEPAKPEPAKSEAKKTEIVKTEAPKPEAAKPEPVKPAPPAPEKRAEAKPDSSPEKAEEKAAAAEPEKKPLSKAVKNEIILEALDNVEVKMQIKGETKRLSLGATQVHTVRSASPVSFDFSDGGAVSITVNGHERGPAGELGKPKQITIP